MKVQFIVSVERLEPAVMRRLDGDQRGLVVCCPWDQSPAATLAALHDLLTEVERVELEAALRDGKERP